MNAKLWAAIGIGVVAGAIMLPLAEILRLIARDFYYGDSVDVSRFVFLAGLHWRVNDLVLWIGVVLGVCSGGMFSARAIRNIIAMRCYNVFMWIVALGMWAWLSNELFYWVWGGRSGPITKDDFVHWVFFNFPLQIVTALAVSGWVATNRLKHEAKRASVGKREEVSSR